MKIILVSDYFYPISNGGTEKYVYTLAIGLKQSNNSAVKILSHHPTLKQNIFKDISIDYLKSNTNNNPDVVNGTIPASNLEEFKGYLQNEQPDIVHFHSLTTNFNHFHIEASNKLGFKTFFTSHIPGDLCLRGDFMQNGKKPCNGEVNNPKCIRCITFSNEDHFYKKWIKYLYYTASKHNPIQQKLKNLKSIKQNTNSLISVCQWQKDYFIRNGFDKEHIYICRQATDKINITKSDSSKVRLGFLGRIDPVKGLHLLIDALNLADNSRFSLIIAAIVNNNIQDSYFESLKRKSKHVNSKWLYNLDNDKIDSFFKDIDYLIVPSLCLETGPFVIYEALAAGIPVVTTNMGGQKELIKHSVNGFLFEPEMKSLMNLINKLDKSIKIAPQSFRNKEEISKEMMTIYLNTTDKH